MKTWGLKVRVDEASVLMDLLVNWQQVVCLGGQRGSVLFSHHLRRSHCVPEPGQALEMEITPTTPPSFQPSFFS